MSSLDVSLDVTIQAHKKLKKTSNQATAPKVKAKVQKLTKKEKAKLKKVQNIKLTKADKRNAKASQPTAMVTRRQGY